MGVTSFRMILPHPQGTEYINEHENEKSHLLRPHSHQNATQSYFYVRFCAGVLESTFYRYHQNTSEGKYALGQ